MNNTEVFRLSETKKKIGQKCLCVVGTLYVHYITIFIFSHLELVLRKYYTSWKVLICSTNIETADLTYQQGWYKCEFVNLNIGRLNTNFSLFVYFKWTWLLQNESHFSFYYSYIIIGSQLNLCSWKKWYPEFNFSPFSHITNNNCFNWKKVRFRLNYLLITMYKVETICPHILSSTTTIKMKPVTESTERIKKTTT